jgi:hypothetical protein
MRAMAAVANDPDTGEVGFYVQRVWPWAAAVARTAIVIGLIAVVAAAGLVRHELDKSSPAKALALVAVATAAAGLLSAKIAKDFAERVTKLLAATVSVGAMLYAAGVFGHAGLQDNQFLAVVLTGVALQLVIYGGASLTFQAAVNDGDAALRTWAEAADHGDRPVLKTRPVGVWELLTAPLLFVTFKGIFTFDLPHPVLCVLGFAVLYALLLVTAGVYVAVPRLMLTAVVTKDEAEHYLRLHGAVPARALPLRMAWKRTSTWRRASLPRTGPYRLRAFRRVCRLLGVPEPQSEWELAAAEQ